MRFTITLFMSLIVGIVSAQAPQGVGYQGVATDSEGIELVNQAISIRASILSGSVNGTVQWQETHDTTTDEFGLFALTIGEGVNTGSGLLSSFADIPWGESTYFLQIEMDATGGMDYSLMGVNQMMSVPYALYAESTNLDYDSIANYLSGDSTFVTNISNGLGGGGCDYDYPDGKYGEFIDVSITSSNNNTYTVPLGKRLYISRITGGGGLDIDGVELFNGIGNYPVPRPLLSTLIANENQILTLSQESSEIRFIGWLVDASSSIEPISYSLAANYTIPTSKILVITYLNRGTGSIQLNGNGIIQLADGAFNAFSLDGGGVLDGSGSFNGYLVDEDYFADCGGGGSSEGGSVSSLDSLTIVNMINDALSNSVSIGVGDYYGGGKVGYIFQPGDADYILGETHGYIFYDSGIQMEWGCSVNTGAISLDNGLFNTEQIITTCPNENTAAKYCYDLIIGPHNDWFLPSVNQIFLLEPFAQEFILGAANTIWSSNEVNESFLEQYGTPGGCGVTGYIGYNNIPHDWAVDVNFTYWAASGVTPHVAWKSSPCASKRVIPFREF